MNKEKWNKMLIDHKKLIAGMGNQQLKNPEESKLFTRVLNTGEELALVYAGCKCEKCKSERNLTIHHIIDRRYKRYTDFWKYETQRRYWANLIVLCITCHCKLHPLNNEEEMLTISQEKIDEIKKEYEIE